MPRSATETATQPADHTPMTRTVDDVVAQFRMLRMPGAAAAFATRSTEPSFCQLDVVAQFHEILQSEMVRRQQNYYTRNRAAAGLPSPVTAAELMPRRAEYGLSPSMVRLLASADWRATLHRIIISPTCSGKTDLATAILDAAIAHRQPCRYSDYSLAMMDLTRSYAAGDPDLYQQRLKHYADAAVLALDDICNGVPRQGEASVFKDLLDACDARNCRLVLVAQQEVQQWHAFLGGGTAADAVLDRVMHNQHLIKLGGNSKRSGKARELKESELPIPSARTDAAAADTDAAADRTAPTPEPEAGGQHA